MDVILGIDTSCYTTSVAVADIATEKCVKYELILLSPENGQKGLRQSTALFFHIKNLPLLLEKLCANEDFNIKGVCASIKPRPVAGSYMPVFEAGASTARSIAASLNVPFYETTHQENHIMAVSNGATKYEFYAVHLSGGTTELLKVKTLQCGFDINLVSATLDISFGKLVDRIGVRLGLDFPAGVELERLAKTGKPVFVPNVKLYNGNISLSGAEKQFLDACDAYSREDIAAGLFEYIGRLLAEWIGLYADKGSEVLFAGGVASNAVIRSIIADSPKLCGVNCRFAEPELCRDNAVGTSVIGIKKYMSENKI